MKVERTEHIKSRHRVVDYYIPRCRLKMTYWYYGTNRQMRAYWRYKRKNKRHEWLRPTIKFENDAAMLMFETYLAELFKVYKSPRNSYTPGSYRHGQFVWRDILDRYVGGDLSSEELIMGWHSVQVLVKEMKEHGKFPGEDADQ